MKRKSLLIDSDRLKISAWAKLGLFILMYIAGMLVMSFVENLVSLTLHIPFAKIYVITLYIRAFIVLSLVHDLVPKFKKTISVLLSIYLTFAYLQQDAHAGDKAFLGTLLFITITFIFNIFIYRKTKKENSNKTMITQ